MVVCIQPQNPDLVHVRGCGQSRSSRHRAGTVFHTRDCTGGSGHRVGTVSQTQDSGHRAETVPKTHDCTVGSRQSESSGHRVGAVSRDSTGRSRHSRSSGRRGLHCRIRTVQILRTQGWDCLPDSGLYRQIRTLWILWTQGWDYLPDLGMGSTQDDLDTVF